MYSIQIYLSLQIITVHNTLSDTVITVLCFVIELLKNVYNENHFDDPSIAPVIKLNDEKYLLELFHGPTWAFKDYSLLLVGELLQYYLVEEIERTCLLIGKLIDLSEFEFAFFFLFIVSQIIFSHLRGYGEFSN